MSNDDVQGGLYRVVSKSFKTWKKQDRINLSLTKEQALVDFISCYPSILSRSVSPSSVAKGFMYNGMVDLKSKHWPDMKGILATCKNIALTNQEEGRVKQLLPKLYEEQMQKGHLSDDFLEGLGFHPDRNYSGDTVRRTAAITN